MRFEHKVIAASVCLAASYWLLDALKDWLLHYGGSFRQLLITDVPTSELSSRIAVSGLLLLLGAAVARTLLKQKQAEYALRNSERHFRSLIENASDAISILNPDGTVRYGSSSVQRVLGYRPDELVGRQILDYIHPDDVAGVSEAFAETAGAPEQPVTREVRFMHKDGSWRTVEGTGCNFLHDETVNGIVVNYRDVSERKHAERELHQLLAAQEEQNQQLLRAQSELAQALEAGRQSEEKLKLYLESSPDIICVVDLQGIILYVNSATEKLIGYRRTELVGKSFTALNLLTPESQSKPREWTYRGGAERSTRSHEVEIRKKDGEVAILDIASYPMGQGLNAEIIAVGRDITEHRRMEEEKQRMEQQLLLSGRLAAVGELSAGVAHELNNPLAAVQGYAQFLTSRNDLDESMREDVETIYKEAQRASKITANLLQFSRKHEPEKKSISINEVIEDSIELNAYRLKVNNIEISADLDPELPKTMADFFQLQQVFVNLMTNAEQAMARAHGRGTLNIASGLAKGAIRVTFTDDGPGIPKENQKKIFDPFFTTKEVGEGTGLGLSICFGIVEQHGGTIEVKSTVGKGTVFTVELPAVAGDEKTEQNVANRAERPHEDGKQVGAS